MSFIPNRRDPSEVADAVVPEKEKGAAVGVTVTKLVIVV